MAHAQSSCTIYRTMMSQWHHMSLATATTTTRCHSPCVIDPCWVIHITYPAAILPTIVTLEGTNIHSTHPKVKLAPKRHGPFKVLTMWGVNCKLQLPTTWRIHPVFHNSLLSPYKETVAHGPNYLCPPLEIIGKRMTITRLRQSCNLDKPRTVKESSILSNGRFTQIWTTPGNQPLIWKIPWTLSLLSTNDTLTFPSPTRNLQTLQEQYILKEGMLLWTQGSRETL